MHNHATFMNYIMSYISICSVENIRELGWTPIVLLVTALAATKRLAV